jgi:hypothetical protein
MKIRNLRRALSLQLGITTLLLAGCHSAQQPEPVKEISNPGMVGMADETARVAEVALGKQAEILARGDLARDGQEQLLVVNRFAKAPRSGNGSENSPAIFITRGVILEKSNGKWTEILRCDEHLKNPNGYLGGSSVARATGWQLEFRTDAWQGLELKFTPANNDTGKEGTGTGEPVGHTMVVRWNSQARRYQSLDASHEGYLSEAPALETPQSILR